MKEAVVGIFLFIALLLMIMLTYFSDDEHKLFNKPQFKGYKARFETVVGLREGDPVYLSGLKVGRITGTSLVDTENETTLVEVSFEVDTKYVVRTDTKARIQMTSLMGGKMLSLTPGTPGAPPMKEGNVIETAEAVDIDTLIVSATQTLANIGGTVEEVRPALSKTIGNLQRITDGVEPDRVRKIVEDIQQTAANFREISEKVNKGEGTVARLINDPDLGADVKKAVGDLTRTVEDIRKIMADVEAGKGTVGVLLKDPETAERVKEIAKDIRDITKRLSEGQGTLGLLINEPDVYKDLSSAVKNINDVTGKLASTEGTLGGLINDPEVYFEIKRVLTEAREAVEDAREQAPLSAFGSLIFGAIQ
ncbi:MAG: MCE family protein [Planctomycetes bacterium]|nr:MCE family protein [Planctomycetota bacterium]